MPPSFDEFLRESLTNGFDEVRERAWPAKAVVESRRYSRFLRWLLSFSPALQRAVCRSSARRCKREPNGITVGASASRWTTTAILMNSWW